MLIRELIDPILEMPLQGYTMLGDFNKPGPFRATDRRLVPHEKNKLKAIRFFEHSPYAFRLFFSNITGTGRYGETGPVSPERLQQMFGDSAEQILQGSEDCITVVYVGNSGDRKVMLTPWIMAHRLGHAVQAGTRFNHGDAAWKEADRHFFTQINRLLEQYYNKTSRDRSTSSMRYDLLPIYSALFHSIGTQRSSRTRKINRPYEFLYELFAQYLGTGSIRLNPLPARLPYGRKAWGNDTTVLTLRPDEDAAQATAVLANDMELMFDDVLSSLVGKILVM